MHYYIPFCIFLYFLFSTQLIAQPVFESFAVNDGSNSSATVNRPSGTSANDLLIVGLAYEKGSAESVTPPSGWIEILSTNNSTDCGLRTYYKIATSSEPSSYSFSLHQGSK